MRRTLIVIVLLCLLGLSFAWELVSWRPQAGSFDFQTPVPVVLASKTGTPAVDFKAFLPIVFGSGTRPWRQVANWVYWLSEPDLTAIGTTAYNLAVIDYSRDGGPQGEFTFAEIQRLRQSSVCKRRVLAYLSIGEAEDYRWYWQSGWEPGNPDWIVQVDPDWPGNYYVKFWDPEWQSILYAYLDRILAAGFDGVYLDRPDAIDQPYARGHEQDMIDLVIAIARYGRARSPLREDWGVFPQNAEELGSHAEYLAVVTGIGIEELYYQATNVRVPENERLYREGIVDRFKQAPHGGLILTVDYTNRIAQIDEAYARAASKGYTEYATNVQLDRLRINTGHEPTCH
jgi:cysteinyl-tRNA synthetase, unknown class